MICALKTCLAVRNSGTAWLRQVPGFLELGRFHADAITSEQETGGLLDEILGEDSR
jgi:hypothetical protein